MSDSGSNSSSGKKLKAALKQIKLAIKDEDYARALKAAAVLLADVPDHFQALLFSAVSSVKSGKFTDAEQFYNQAIASDPEQPAAYQGLADLYAKHRNEFPSDPHLKLKDLYTKIIELQGPEATLKGEPVIDALIALLHELGDVPAMLKYKMEKLASLDGNDQQQQQPSNQAIATLDSVSSAILQLFKEKLRGKSTSPRDCQAFAATSWQEMEEMEVKPTEIVAKALKVLSSFEQTRESLEDVQSVFTLASSLWRAGLTGGEQLVSLLVLAPLEKASQQCQERLLSFWADVFVDTDFVQFIARATDLTVVSHIFELIAAREDSLPPNPLSSHFKLAALMKTQKPAAVDWGSMQAHLETIAEAAKPASPHGPSSNLLLLATLTKICLARNCNSEGIAHATRALEIIQLQHAASPGWNLTGLKGYFTVALSRLYIGMEEFDLAFELHEALIALQHTYPPALAALAECQLHKGKMDLAKANLDMAFSLLEQTASNEERPRAVATMDPPTQQSAWLWFDPRPTQLAFANSVLAKISLSIGRDVAQAECAIDEALLHVPGCADFHYLKGMVMKALFQGTSKAPLQSFLVCLKISEGHSKAFCQVGHFYSQAAPEKAIKCYRKALDVNSLNNEAARSLWLLHMDRDDVTAADALVLDLTKETASEKVTWLWLQKGHIHLKRAEPAEAVTAFQVALRRRERDPLTWHLLGDAYQQRGSYTASIRALMHCLELDPTRHRARYLLGNAYLKLGEESEAQACFMSVLAVDPAYAPAVDGCVSAHCVEAKEAVSAHRPGVASEAIAAGLQLLAKAFQAKPPPDATTARPSSFASLWKLCGDLYQLATELPHEYQTRIPMCIFDATASDKCAEPSTAAAFPELGTYERLSKCAAASYRKLYALASATPASTASDHVPYAPALSDLVVNRISHYSVTREDSILHEATALAKALASIAPQDPTSWNLLGIAHFHANDYSVAYECFCKAVSFAPRQPMGWVYLGVMGCVGSVPDTMLANKAFSEAQLLDPGLPDAWTGQSLVAKALDNPETLDLLRHSVTLSPGKLNLVSFSYHALLATTPNIAPESAADPVDAKAILSKVTTGHIPRGEGNNYLDLASVALSLHTSTLLGSVDACAYNMWGLVLEKRSIHAGAISCYRRALALIEDAKGRGLRPWLPQSSSTELEGFSVIVSQSLARTLTLNGDYEEAVETYSTLNIADMVSTCTYAKALFFSNRIQESFQVYEAVRQKTRDETSKAEATVCMAVLAFANDDFGLCKQLLFEAVGNPAACPQALFIMAALGLYARDMELADAALGECPELWRTGTVSDVQFMEQYLTLSHYAYLLNGADRVATSFLLQRVRLFASNSDAWLFLASALLRSKDAKRLSFAAGAVERARELQAGAIVDIYSSAMFLSSGLYRNNPRSCTLATPAVVGSRRIVASSRTASAPATATAQKGGERKGEQPHHTRSDVDLFSAEDGDDGNDGNDDDVKKYPMSSRRVPAVSAALRALRGDPQNPAAWASLAFAYLQTAERASDFKACRTSLSRCLAILEGKSKDTSTQAAFATTMKFKAQLLERWCYLLWALCGVAWCHADPSRDLSEEEQLCKEMLATLSEGTSDQFLLSEFRLCTGQILMCRGDIEGGLDLVLSSEEQAKSYSTLMVLVMHLVRSRQLEAASRCVDAILGASSVEAKLSEEERVKLQCWRLYIEKTRPDGDAARVKALTKETKQAVRRYAWDERRSNGMAATTPTTTTTGESSEAGQHPQDTATSHYEAIFSALKNTKA